MERNAEPELERARIMVVTAHPDDESLGFGGTIASYAAEGAQIHLITATRGEAGRNGDRHDTPAAELGALREAELRSAAAILGIEEVEFLGYPDGRVDQVDPNAAAATIAASIRCFRPHVVLTFGPDGAYGHPDHIAISQFTTAAVLLAAHGGNESYVVSKLYFLAWTQQTWDAYQAALKKLTSKVDGVERQAIPWPQWAITTMVDTSERWRTVWRAVCCHQTQMSIYRSLQALPEEHHRALWGRQEFYRAFSIVNGGRAVERDLLQDLPVARLVHV